MNNKVNDKDYIKLTPFKGWVLENFPFIESDFDCITNYQLLCKITEYLNNVISNQNQVQELGTELVTAYNQLLDYVNNYFDNLDVQDEINLKLDIMAQNGTLTNLIKDYIDPIYQNYENTMNNQYSNFTNNINNEITDLTNRVNSATSGAPIPVSSTSGMTDTTKIYVNTTDGYWYYYNGSAWAQGGVYQSTGIADNSIYYNNLATSVQNAIYYKLSDIDKIYNNGYEFKNKRYIANSGSVPSNQNYTYEGTILTPLYIEKGSTILNNNSGIKVHVGQYNGKPDGTSADYQSKFISRVDLDYNETYTATQDCYILVDVEYLDTSLVAEESILDNLVFNIIAPINERQDEEIANIDEQLKDIYYISSNINAIYNNYFEFKRYYYINNLGGVSVNQNYGNEGTIVTPLYVDKGTTIKNNNTTNIVAHIGEYTGEPDGTSADYQAKFIKKVNLNASNDTYTATQDCYILVDVEYIDSTQVATTSMLSNLLFNVKVNKLMLINNDYEESLYYRDIKKCYLNDYYKGLNEDYSAKNFSGNTTYAQIISAFEELRSQDNNYITRNTLGIGSGTDSLGHDYNIYEYVIKPRNINIVNAPVKSNPKILITAAQQGFEKCDVYGLYYFLYDLINNSTKNSTLSYIKENVELHIIPVVCPWAWDNNLYYNANGVSLNRNYLTPWWETTSPDNPNEYTGTYPFSEPETQIVKTFIEANPDAILLIDNHTNGRYSVDQYPKINWINTYRIKDNYFGYFTNVVSQHVNKITNQFKTEYNLPLGSNVCGMFTYEAISDSIKGNLDFYTSYYKNIIGITFEGFQGFPSGTAFDINVFKANSELIGNFIGTFISIYSNIN